MILIIFQIPSSVFTNDAMVLMANGFHTTILQRETIQESVLEILAFPNTVPVRGAPSQLQGYKFKQIYIHCSGRGTSYRSTVPVSLVHFCNGTQFRILF
ncbi:hypothetical protein BDL97_12G016300 [Sphagnum fallax]|nr:hypothetical protein BDL97_12G016300 [Sphagnum fallax]KAH8944999.1 hypothetical protein BDL97_12G016300 [Sphagnum fallax]